MKTWPVKKLTAAALLTAIGMLIPLVMPSIVIEPAGSYTLVSHVPLFIAMMISPSMAVAVSIGTIIGFQFKLGLLGVTLRAASHLIFASVGSLYLKHWPETLSSPLRIHLFSVLIAFLHAAFEFAIASVFFIYGQGGQMKTMLDVLLFVGLGTIIHSLIDFEIALGVFKGLRLQKSFTALTNK